MKGARLWQYSKMAKVLRSCTTIEQHENAIEYLNLWTMKYQEYPIYNRSLQLYSNPLIISP